MKPASHPPPQPPPTAYGGDDIVQSHTVFLDSHWGVGASVRELVHGVDCPLTAAYMDAVTFYKSMPAPVVHKNAICVFESDQNLPALRHYDYAFQFYGAVKSHMLTVRMVSEVYNYDYICDFNFYVDGTLEPRVQTSGCARAFALIGGACCCCCCCCCSGWCCLCFPGWVICFVAGGGLFQTTLNSPGPSRANANTATTTTHTNNATNNTPNTKHQTPNTTNNTKTGTSRPPAASSPTGATSTATT